MKKSKGFSTAAVVASIVAVVALISLATFFVIDGNNKATNYDNYDFYSIIEADEHNGNIGDHVKGSKDAPIIVYEYADFQCPGCASMNPRVNQAVSDSNGKLAVVYRNYLLSYHQNGTAAASAAEAAGLQGYWKEYADALFENQSEWEYASGSERTDYFTKYFAEVTDGKGDIEKFKQDLGSTQVSKKISFDMGIGKRIDIPATPAFFVEGQYIDWSNKNGAAVTINGKTITWDHALNGTEFIKLLQDIAATAK